VPIHSIIDNGHPKLATELDKIITPKEVTGNNIFLYNYYSTSSQVIDTRKYKYLEGFHIVFLTIMYRVRKEKSYTE
jgi:hypothetical protein